MKMSHLGLAQGCLLVVIALASCGSPATSAPTESTPGPVTEPASQAIEEILIHQMAARICPYPEDPDRIDPYERYFATGDRTYSFTCYPAAGHSISVTMQRFADLARAEAGFESVPELGHVKELQGFPVSDWEEDHPSFPGGRHEYRVRLMQVGQWLIWIRSFDDTHFIIAPDPQEASLAIIQVLRAHGISPSMEE